MKPARTISEQFAGTPLEGVAASDINEAEGYIDNVVVCGFTSKNNRKYPRSTFDRDFKKYEGAKVNFDHKPAAAQRDFDDMGGWLSHVRQGDDGRPRARLNVYKTDRRSAKVFEAARRNPTSFGLSHMAVCETRRDRDGCEVVESIGHVQSVDIVHTPATTSGLYESARSTPPVKTTLSEYVKAVAPTTPLKGLLCLKRLAEMDDLGAMEMDAPADTAADPDDAIWAGFEAAFRSAITQYGEDNDMPALLAAIKKYAKAHQGMIDTPDDDTETDAETDPVKDEAAKPKPDAAAAIYECIAVCEAAGVKGTALQIKTLVRADPADRKALAESFHRPAVAAERPKAPARAADQSAPPAKLSWVDAN